MHEVDEAAGGGDDDLCAALEGPNLALYARAAIDGEDVQAVDIAGIVFQVVGNLEAELARRTEDDGLRGAVVGVDFLEYGQAEGGRLARAGLGQGDDVVALAEQIGDDLLLYGHRALVAHLSNGAADGLAHAQFFKTFQWEITGERYNKILVGKGTRKNPIIKTMAASQTEEKCLSLSVSQRA